MIRKLPARLRGAARPGAGRKKPIPITLPAIDKFISEEGRKQLAHDPLVAEEGDDYLADILLAGDHGKGWGGQGR